MKEFSLNKIWCFVILGIFSLPLNVFANNHLVEVSFVYVDLNSKNKLKLLPAIDKETKNVLPFATVKLDFDHILDESERNQFIASFRVIDTQTNVPLKHLHELTSMPFEGSHTSFFWQQNNGFSQLLYTPEGLFPGKDYTINLPSGWELSKNTLNFHVIESSSNLRFYNLLISMENTEDTSGDSLSYLTNKKPCVWIDYANKNIYTDTQVHIRGEASKLERKLNYSLDFDNDNLFTGFKDSSGDYQGSRSSIVLDANATDMSFPVTAFINSKLAADTVRTLETRDYMYGTALVADSYYALLAINGRFWGIYQIMEDVNTGIGGWSTMKDRVQKLGFDASGKGLLHKIKFRGKVYDNFGYAVEAKTDHEALVPSNSIAIKDFNFFIPYPIYYTDPNNSWRVHQSLKVDSKVKGKAKDKIDGKDTLKISSENVQGKDSYEKFNFSTQDNGSVLITKNYPTENFTNFQIEFSRLIKKNTNPFVTFNTLFDYDQFYNAVKDIPERTYDWLDLNGVLLNIFFYRLTNSWDTGSNNIYHFSKATNLELYRNAIKPPVRYYHIMWDFDYTFDQDVTSYINRSPIPEYSTNIFYYQRLFNSDTRAKYIDMFSRELAEDGVLTQGYYDRKIKELLDDIGNSLPWEELRWQRVIEPNLVNNFIKKRLEDPKMLRDYILSLKPNDYVSPDLNHPPEILLSSFSSDVLEGQLTELQINAKDVDGDHVSLSVDLDQSGATFDSVKNKILWRPNEINRGKSYHWKIKACDDKKAETIKQVDVSVKSFADLAITELSTDSVPDHQGQKFAWKLKIMNIGNAPTLSAAQVYVVLRFKNSEKGLILDIDKLNAGQEVNYSNIMQISESGEMKFIAQIENGIFATGDTNPSNDRVENVYNIFPKPDLTLSNVYIFPVIPVLGQGFNVSFIVHNAGLSNVPAHLVQMNLLNDQGHVLESKYAPVPIIGPNQDKAIVYWYDTSNIKVKGKYKLQLVVDRTKEDPNNVNGVINESNETNNVVDFLFDLIEFAPDLVVKSIGLEGSNKVGQMATLQVIVSNIGSIVSDKYTDLVVDLSKISPDSGMFRKKLPAIKPNMTYTFNIPVRLNSVAGMYNVYANIPQSYKEVNVDNNTINQEISVIGVVEVAPLAPTGLSAKALSPNSIELTWKDVANNETGYKVQRSSSSTGSFADLKNLTANSSRYTDIDLDENTTYYYKVCAINATGSSCVETPVSATTHLTVPVAPTGLSAKALSPNSIELTWKDVANNETGYRVQILNPITKEFIDLKTLVANSSRYTDIDLDENTTYYYKVCAVNATGSSCVANSVAVTTRLAAPAVPTGLKAKTLSSSSIGLTWTDAANNETGYMVQRSSSRTGSFTDIKNLSANSSNYTDSSLKDNTTYYYKVCALNATGSSCVEAPVSATTDIEATAAQIIAPAAGTELNTSTVTFIRDAGIGVSGYELLVGTEVGADNYYHGVMKDSSQEVRGILLDGNTMYVRLNSTINGVVQSKDYRYTTVKFSPLPVVPVGLTAKAVSSSSIELIWTDMATNETSYKVQRSSSSTGSFTDIKNLSANNTSYTDSGLTESTTYYYKVCAVNDSGSSCIEPPISASTIVQPARAQIISPVLGIQLDTSSVTFIRDVGVGVEKYQLLVGANLGGDDYYNGSMDTTSQVVKGIPLDGNPIYVRLGSTIDGKVQYKDYMHNTIKQETVPVAPSSLTVKALSSISVELGWEDLANNETAYKVQTLNPATKVFIDLKTLPANSTSFVDNNLDENTKYFYKVCAVNAVGSVCVDSPVEVTTPIHKVLIPAVPSSLTAKTILFDSVELVWADKAGNETGFKVQRLNSKTGSFEDVTTLAADSSSYTDTGLTANTTYSYKVCAVNEAGSACVDKAVEVTTPEDVNKFNPDLAIKRIWWAGSNKTDQLATIQVVVTNIGTAVSDKNAEIIVDLSKIAPASGTVRETLPAIEPNMSHTLNLPVRLNSRTGIYNVHANIPQSYREVNIANNTRDQEIIVWVYAVPYELNPPDYVTPSRIFPAQITSPADGGNLTTTTVTFTRDEGVGAKDYQLLVGKTVGNGEYYNGPMNNLVQTVNGIVLDGNPVYVRLNSTVGGVVKSMDYKYITQKPIQTPDAPVVDPSGTTTVSNVSWTNASGVLISGNSLTKTASTTWGNSGAFSTQGISGDGYLQFTADSSVGYKMIGLSTSDGNKSWETAQYAIYLMDGGNVMVYESGTGFGPYVTYKAGDVFTIERKGTAILYKKNGVEFVPSGRPSTGTLYADAAIFDTSAAVKNAVIGFTQ